MNHEGIRRHEGHEDRDTRSPGMRKASVLSPEEERVVRSVIGAVVV